MAPRPLTDKEKRGAISTLTGGMSQVFTDAYTLLTDRAGFIADDEPSSPLAAAVRDVNRYTCRLWARSPGDGFQGSSPQRMAEVCTPYLDNIAESPTPANLAPPEVSGGQCPGVNYAVVVFQNRADNGAPAPPFSIGTHPGPISSIANPFPPPDCSTGANTLNNRYYFVNGQGVPIYQDNSCSLNLQNPRLECTPTTPEPPGGCGSTPVRIEPAAPRPGLPPLPPRLTVGLPGIGDVAVEVGFNPSGQITVGLPELGVEGTVNIGDPGGSGDDDDAAPGPGDVGEPGTTEGTGEGGDAEGEAPEGSVIVGLRIDFADEPKGGVQYRPGVYRGVCYVYMGTDEGLDHDPAGAMMRDGQFVFAEKDNLTKWAVRANRGYNLRVTPYYRQIETEEE